MVLSYHEAVDGPAVMQLRKWKELQVQLNLSEFREAFLSPTRELLLLLSYQCEALLLPLIAGEISPCIATSGDGLERRNSDQETSTSPCCSTERTASGRSGSLYASQSTSGPVKTAPNSTFSHEQSSSTFKQYPVVCNVKSLAWGHCGDAYDQRKDADFKELLVVSGNHGITIHCFRYLDKNREITRLGPDDGLVQGRWVEWGPSATSKHNLQAEEQLSSYSRSSESFLEEKRATGTTRNPHDIQGSADFHDSSGSCFPSKCWFRSFLAEVETIKSEGSFLTRFPAKSSCPCSAEVVSFTISFRTSIFLDFLSHATPVSNANEKQREYAMSGLMTDTSLYRFTCSSVFSSSSHRLIGMVLTLPEPLPIDTCQGGEHNGSRIMVMVAMLYQWGIQWLCSVDLPDYSPELGPEFEWTDFKFSDKYLLCLNKLGLVLILSSTTGELVARVDVLQCCGMHLKSESVAENPMLSIDGASAPDSCVKQDEWGNEVHGKMNHLVGGYFSSKRIFKRLMVAFNSSQFATVDDYGVVYVICADDFISEKDFAANKLTYFHNHELGILAGWKIAGSEICSQREFSDIIKLKDSNVSWMESDKPSPKGYGGDAKRWKELKRYMSWDGNESDPNLNCFSSSSQKNGVCIPQADISSMPIRRILLPKYRFSKADSVCFSPFGLIQLVNKCNVKDQKGFKIVRTRLTVASAVDDGDLNSCMHPRMSSLLEQEQAYPGQAIGFSFQGSFYFISQDGLSIVLPSVSVSSSILPIESFGYWRPSLSTLSGYQVDVLLEVKEPKELWPPWKLEVLDRALIYEGPEEADNLCLENGWDLKIARMRRLQLALDYFKYDEIERSLDMLVDVNLAEEGVLRLLFTSVYQIFCKVGNDNEVALASRFLALAACFATKMVRRYGLLEHKKERFIFRGVSGSEVFYLQATLPKNRVSDINNARRLQEMAHFLEIIRNLQQRLSKKCKRPGPGMVDNVNALSLADSNAAQDDSPLPILNADTVSPVLTDALDVQNQGESAFPISDSALDSAEKLALSTMDSLISSNHLDSGNFHEIFVHDSQGFLPRRKMIPLENPKDMIARWEVDNLDMRTVVKDALHSGRLPLAVLQLRLQRLRDLATTEKEPHDTFNDVRDVGRAIAYDLFLKGETGLAIATLRRLGEDIEVSLRQLAFGTVRRPLRIQVALEMKQHGYLGPYEWKILERISLIERLYPSSSFWGTYLSRQKQLNEVSSGVNMPEGCRLQLTCSTASSDYTIECGEVDGAVIGSWANIDEDSSFPLVDEDSSHAGYWAGAAVWSDAWDERTMDRIVLDQPFLMGVHTLWESQLEYHISHNDWDEVSKLLDMIPPSLLLDGSLQVSLDGLHAAATAIVECGERKSGHDNYFFPADELDPVCINVPNIKIFRFPAGNMCSMLLRMLVEKQLAKRFIFLKEYWEGTAEIIPLLARAGFVINTFKISNQGGSTESSSDLEIANITEEFHEDTVQALHKLVVYHCTRYSLPNLLDLYLDHHQLVLDNDSLGCLQEAAGECQWAKWLLLSRIKGCEYDASFSNARSIMSHNVIHSNNLSVPDIDEIVRTIDDIAEGGGEMAALATLMYAPAPIQKCLCSGSVNRHCSSSSQCTLENLRPGLQHFPTLWRTLVSACFGHDVDGNPFCFTAKRVFGKSALSDYFHWRDQIFSSTGGDTSLMQMLPCWFSKFIRRLVQIFVQGPLGWQSLLGARTGESFMHRDNYLDSIGNDNVEAHAISWEATIQKNIEEELYASSFEENGFGVEHHLRRGRALAAFNHLLGMRTPKLKSANAQQEPSGSSMHGQTNIQSDVQTLLAPLAQDEDSILSSVMPLAILHFEDSALVASCAFLLELCGLSASMLRVDVAALRRISSFYNSIDHNEQHKHLSPKGSALHAVSSEDDLTIPLARALAEDYQHHDNLRIGQKDTANRVAASRQPSRALMSVLQYLEKASLPMFVEGNTCGSWLLSGIGDGTEFRSHQKDASQRWHLVTAFCQLHQLPLSTKYLAVLAKDNDWVGFLSEAQVGGFPFDVVVQVASEFNDPRLKIHILTVLRSMQSTRKKVTTSTNPMPSGKSSENSLSIQSDFMIPVELFGILAECEKQKNPGEALLIRAKDLRWSLLAMVASCFPDVSPLSCLTVWLEITAARETSSIKVNDISSQIANSVGAAVESTNALPTGSRTLMFRYNRRNAKRRCLMEQASENALSGAHFDAFGSSSAARVSAVREIAAEEARKNQADKPLKFPSDPDDELTSLSKMVAVLCEQHLFLPLLRAFEMFLPSCSLLPFVRSLQAFSQMRLSEATAHLASFSSRVKEERHHTPINIGRDGKISTTWISSTAVKAADAMLSTCPSAYEKRCLLQLLAAADFGDGGSAAACFRRLYWKIDLAEPSLRKSDDLYLGNETLDDAALLTALEKNGHWEQARNWARQLESSGAPWKSVVHHVTETQAEAMVAEWKEFLWDVPEERAALWGHCQTLFIRYSFPSLQAGLFFLKHAEAVEKDIPARELHEMLLLSLQWLSGTITQSSPVYPLHLLREIETRVWLLAVESEAQIKTEGDLTTTNYSQNPVGGNSTSIIDQTAIIIAKMDNHLNAMRARATERNENTQTHIRHPQVLESNSPTTSGGGAKVKRRAKSYLPSRRSSMDAGDRTSDLDDNSTPLHLKSNNDLVRSLQLQEENVRIEASLTGWEERLGPAELEKAVLSLLEFGQITAAKQLQQKLSPSNTPSEFALVDAALKIAVISSPSGSGEASMATVDQDSLSVIQSYNIPCDSHLTDPLQLLETLATKFPDGCGRGLCKRIIAVVKAANVLGISFSEAFGKRPIELLQLLSLKAQDSLEQAKLLVQTHSMPPASIARILAESFLKGLLAAHRGGYMDCQKEEGPAPLLWRLSDFLKWAELCPSEPEVGHALMRLVITGQEIPHACEVELLILAHHFYKSSACLDGVDVLVALAATRVESYVLEGDFSCLARLVTGVSNFHALNFILGILIENGQLELLLHKYSATDTTTGTAEAVRGFRMAVLTSLKHFNPHDLDAFAMVYNHFDMKHETASLLESRAIQSMQNWLFRYDKDQNEDLLESMRYFIEAAEVHSTIDAGNKTRRACAQASLLSLQIRMPDFAWINLSETNARRALVEQSRFQEALIVAEAYGLNQPSEWALVLWNQMLKPDLTEQFVAEFVAVLPLQPSMLVELARFYRAEVAARGDQSHFSVWLSPGGLPAEWAKHLGRSFRSLLKRTRDLRVRTQLATIATGFGDVVDVCMKALDKVPDTAGPLILRKAHGGAYLPLWN